MSLPNTTTSYHANILRDTGAAMSIIEAKCVPNTETAFTGEKVVAAALGTRVPCPVAKVYVKSPMYMCKLKVMVMDQPFEIPNVLILMRNEVKGSQMIQIPLVVEEPSDPS